MKCVIELSRPLRNKFEIITLKDDKIYFDDGKYERILIINRNIVDNIYEELFKIVFNWKQEYIGERIYDGEKYLIEFEINHKKKKYKIQNKFPSNWDAFLNVRNRILEYRED